MVNMKINVNNAEKIFKKALDTLKGDMTEAGEQCDYRRWVDDCRRQIE